MSRRRKWLLLAIVLGLVAVCGWAFWLSPLEAGPWTCQEVECTTGSDGSATAKPSHPARTALIVYTGARVAPGAYLPLAEKIAAAGYPVFIPKLTANLAIADADAADAVIDAHPEVEQWVIAGHSLGGAMAARYAAQDRRVAGLVFWAAYPEQSLSLRDNDLVVASISASNDGLATSDEITGAAARLPAGTRFVVIEGGNHAQFGNYGEQRGDGPAAISAAEQWQRVALATVAVLDAASP